jgi:serine phosphatase RsbU (regulator of sigma subunit)
MGAQGAATRATDRMFRMRRLTQLSRLPMRERLRFLGLLGVLLTLLVAGTALVSLADVGASNRELGAVTRAQRFHQDADMMHDALRADVARAQQAGSGPDDIDPVIVRLETATHVRLFRRDLSQLAATALPDDLASAFSALRPQQERYMNRAEQMVSTGLAGREASRADQAAYQQAFDRLTADQRAVTDDLMATSARTERVADTEEAIARRMVVLSSMAALTGWLALVVWLSRSVGSLRAALVREAEQRSAADLLQRSLLPQHLPAVPGVRLAARSLPGNSGARVGGDWYDVIALPGGEIGLVVGDVVGHDLPAATAMGQLRNTLRAYALENASPAAVLERVNRAADLLQVADMATCVYAVLDPRTLTVRLASAGHLPPLVTSPSGSGRLLRAEPGPPLGVLPDAHYCDERVPLQRGGALVLYTDGLVERRSEPIDTGLNALEAAPGSHPGPEAMCDELVRTMLGGAVPGDDVTLLLVQT